MNAILRKTLSMLLCVPLILLIDGCDASTSNSAHSMPPSSGVISTPTAPPFPSSTASSFISAEDLAESIMIDSLTVDCQSAGGGFSGNAPQPYIVLILSYHFSSDKSLETMSDMGISIEFPNELQEAVGVGQTAVTVYERTSKAIYSGEQLFCIASPQISESQVYLALLENSKFNIVLHEYSNGNHTKNIVPFQGTISEPTGKHGETMGQVLLVPVGTIGDGT